MQMRFILINRLRAKYVECLLSKLLYINTHVARKPSVSRSDSDDHELKSDITHAEIAHDPY